MMNLWGRAVLVALSGVAFGSLANAGDLGVDVTIRGEIAPGVYGHVDLGNRAPPPVVYAQPMVIERGPPGVVAEPIYLHVPPGHARDWRHHCHEYHACNRPVYFVRSREYEPEYQRRPEFERRREEEIARQHEIERSREYDHGHGHDHDHDHDHDHGHHDHDHDHDRHDH